MDRGWIVDGSRMDRRRIEDGSRMDRRWIEDGSRMDRGWIEDGSRMDRGWIKDGSRMDRGWIEDGSGIGWFVGRWAGWLNSGPPPPGGEKISQGWPQKEDYLCFFARGWIARYVSIVMRVDLCRSAFDSNTPRSRRIFYAISTRI